MNSQRGRGCGITGIFDITGSPSFTLDAFSFKQRFTTKTAPRSGRGDGEWENAASRAFAPGSTVALTGGILPAGYPMPDSWKGQEGSLTLQFHRKTAGATPAKQVLTVRVIDAEITSKGDDEGWGASFVCLVLANPTFSGFGGTQAAATVPTKSDKEVWAGLTKVYDPNNLLTSATFAYDVWPLGDTDAAERQKLADLVASLTARFTGAKVKYARLEPGRTNDAGIITVQQSLTDSAEDVVNPATAVTLDPNNLTSQATAAGINTPATAPAGNLVKRERTTREIHDAASLITDQYGTRDTIDDVQMPGTTRRSDPAALGSSETVTLVRPTGTTPATPTPTISTMVLRGVDREELNRYQWRHTFVYGETTTEQDITFPGSPTETDPSGLTDSALDTDVTDSSTPHASNPPAGLKLRRTTSVRRTDSGKWVHAHEYARRNTEDDIEMPGTSTTDDPSDLADQRVITVVHTTGTASEVLPATPSGLKIRETYTEQLHDAKWMHRFTFSRRNREDDEEMGGSHTLDDPSNLGDRQVIAVLHSSADPSGVLPATPSGLKLRDTRTDQRHDSRWLHTFEFSRTNREDDIEMPATVRRIDPLAIESEARTTEVYDTASPPADPSAPSAELQLIGRQYTVLHDSKSKRETQWDVLTSEQKREYPHTKTTTDAATIDLRSHSMQADVYSGSPPADPTAPTGQKLLEKFDVPITPGKTMRVWIFGKLDSVDEAEFRFERIIVDANGIQSAEVQATVYLAGAAPADPSAPSGLKLRLRHDHPLNPTIGAVAAKFVRVWYFEVNDTADDVLNPLNVTSVDPSGLQSEQRKASFGTPALDAGYVERATSTKTHVTGKTLTVKEGGLRSTQQDVEYPGTTARYSPTRQNQNRITEVLSDTGSTVLSLASTYGATRKADPTFDWVEYERLTIDRVKRTVQETSDFEIIDAISIGGVQPVLCVAGAGVLVHMARKLKRGSSGGVTLYHVLLAPISAYVSRIEFTLHRRVPMTTTLPFMSPSLVGRTNAGNFLGLPAFTTAFLSANPVTNIKVPTPRLVDLRLRFLFSSIGHFDTTGIIEGWSTGNYDIAGASDGTFVQASNFGASASVSPSIDFDQFLPTP